MWITSQNKHTGWRDADFQIADLGMILIKINSTYTPCIPTVRIGEHHVKTDVH